MHRAAENACTSRSPIHSLARTASQSQPKSALRVPSSYMEEVGMPSEKKSASSLRSSFHRAHPFSKYWPEEIPRLDFRAPGSPKATGIPRTCFPTTGREGDSSAGVVKEKVHQSADDQQCQQKSENDPGTIALGSNSDVRNAITNIIRVRVWSSC
jgi:hypothetical protein